MVGRPREFDRGEMLAKARDAFWVRGYEGVSMADLVEAMGIASARIYAAFGSKEQLFREAVELYETGEGGFAARALAEEETARSAIGRMLRDAIELYCRPGRPSGCMVVAAATNCAAGNDAVGQWLAAHRRERTAAIIDFLRGAEAELPDATDPEALGDQFAALLHGLSVQARDGVPKERLLALVAQAMRVFDR